MKNSVRILAIGLVTASLSSCSTQILTTSTTLPGATTTTTVPVPSGTSVQLLEQLQSAVDGLGQAVVDKDRDTMNHKVAQVDAIWKVLEPQVRESGVDLVDDIQKIVDFVHVAVNRIRPAEADKAVRFLGLIMETAPTLLQ
jgi:hypothetical protein